MAARASGHSNRSVEDSRAYPQAYPAVKETRALKMRPCLGPDCHHLMLTTIDHRLCERALNALRGIDELYGDPRSVPIGGDKLRAGGETFAGVRA